MGFLGIEYFLIYREIISYIPCILHVYLFLYNESSKNVVVSIVMNLLFLVIQGGSPGQLGWSCGGFIMCPCWDRSLGAREILKMVSLTGLAVCTGCSPEHLASLPVASSSSRPDWACSRDGKGIPRCKFRSYKNLQSHQILLPTSHKSALTHGGQKERPSGHLFVGGVAGTTATFCFSLC